MFNILGLQAGVYEAIIAGLIALSLIQVLVLRSKWWQCEKLKSDNSKLAESGLRARGAIFAAIGKIGSLTFKNTILKRQVADLERKLMEAAADRDDAADNSRTSPVDEGTKLHHIIENMILGGGRSRNPFGDTGEHVATFELGRDGTLRPLDGKSAAFADENGIDIHGGAFNRDPHDDRPFTAESLHEALRGLSRRTSRRDPLHDILFGNDSPFRAPRSADPGEPVHPTFGDTDELPGTFAKGGFVPETPEAAAARHFGPDSGAANTKASPTGNGATEPRSYPQSSPRAG